MSVTPQELETVLGSVSERLAEKQDRTAAKRETQGQLGEIEQEQKALDAEIAEIEARAGRDDLLPEGGGTAVAAADTKRLQQLKGKQSELSTRLDTRRRQEEEAKEALQEAALAAVRAVAAYRMETALPRWLDALAEAGASVVDPWAEVEDAGRALSDLDAEMKRAADLTDADPAQLSRLRGHVRRGDRGVEGAALVGWALLETLRWLRRFSDGPVGEFLRENDIEPVDGSPRHRQPFGALEDVVAALESGRIPGGTSRL